MRAASLLAAAILAGQTLFATNLHAAGETFEIVGGSGSLLQATTVAEFDEPWAMTFLPDGTMLVTTKPGKLFYVTQEGNKTEVEGIWEVAYGGQGGLGDVVLHPNFENNDLIYISNAETLDHGATFGAIVSRVKLDRSGRVPKLMDVEKIWTQEPKMPGQGHYSHRIAFGPDGMLYITSGDRQKQKPAQNFDQALGKIIRLNDDGGVPVDNPWQDEGELAKTYWSMGHRNLLGIDFDGEGRLWTHEMGPAHGDELNLIVAGDNYGWPIVSNGDNYSGTPIPDHETRPDFNAPEAFWVPAISPSGFVIYDGDMFPDWQGDGFIGGLSSQALVRVDIDGESANEAERFEWGERVREVEQGPDGALWVLEDKAGARLLKLTPNS
ncbi:MAG: PQQ-dependent sugar dehydrogenase [Alphaproteobacteria bacterium]|nr:PQQ-dependent sugar dehydrogenase [Alphaproteobacteria bacterium]